MRLRPSEPPQDREKNVQTFHDKSRIVLWISKIFRRDTIAQPPQENPAAHFNSSRNSKTPYTQAESEQASANLWAIYIDEADRYDTALVESWRADMEGMLIFSGLFSASLTAFLIESYRTLQPDSGDTAAQLLAQISQQLVALSNNAVFTPAAAVDFRPTQTSLICNTLWFLSLSLSMTCALLATLVEQWAREFIHKTQKRPGPVRRAHVLSFIYFGIRRFRMHAVVDLIPMLLHVSLIFFLGGLVAFLLPINRIMMSLISTILAVFGIVYAVLTILPIFSPDCPYRTPFSPLAWKIMQTLQERVFIFEHQVASTSRTMYDTMVSFALRPAKHRDQRALAWTMDSLTEDNELLPFLDAIPEAIHGITGFHSFNNYLLTPLLAPSAGRFTLGRRITDTLLSCRKMAPDDPICRQRLIVGMKALWAIGMISDSSETVDETDGVYWLEDITMEAIHEPNRWKVSWPRPYEQAAGVAILYSHLNNMRNYIRYLIRLVDGNQYAQLAEGLSLVKEHVWQFENLSERFKSRSRGRLVTFNSTDVEKVAAARTVLESLTHEEIWEEVAVSISSRFLLIALHHIDLGGDLPYRLMESCLKIVPGLPPYPNHLDCMDRSHIFEPVRIHLFDPLRHKTVIGKISSLDHIMRYYFRLLPLLRREDVVPKFALYLARRGELSALYFATELCYHPGLLDALVEVLSTYNDPNILHAIGAVMLLRQFFPLISLWIDRDEVLWHHLSSKMAVSGQFMPLSNLMLHRKLYHLYQSSLMVAEEEAKKGDSADEEMHRLASHPLLSGWVHDSTRSSGYTAEAFWDLTGWVKSAMIVALTGFLSVCVQQERPPYIPSTLNAICQQCLADSFEDVEVNLMMQFAENWVTMIKHLRQHPEDSQLHGAIMTLFLWIGGPVTAFFNPHAALLFHEALSLFLTFLQDQVETDESTIEKTKTAIEDLATRMTIDVELTGA